MTTIGLNMKVKFKDYDASADVREASRRLMVFGGVRLRSIMIEEASKRSDGLGGPTGAKDTGALTNSIVILSQDYKHVSVGTNISYAKKLAFGDPDPGARLEWIRKWRVRKNVPRRAKQVWKKVKTKGPIANPFHERTKKKFLKEWPGIQREALGK